MCENVKKSLERSVQKQQTKEPSKRRKALITGRTGFRFPKAETA